MKRQLLFRSDMLHSLGPLRLQYLKDVYVLCEEQEMDDFRIVEISNKRTSLKKINRACSVYELSNQVMIPGFFDMHFHWVQDAISLKPKDELLQWLKKHAWPNEKKYQNVHFAYEDALRFSKKLIQQGTFGGAVYCSKHSVSVDAFMNHCVGEFIAGHVLMTEESPSYLKQTKKEADDLIFEYFKKYKKSYALTPRFAPTVHPQQMIKWARLANTKKAFIQTHLSENKEEIDYVLNLYRNQYKGFEKVKSYTEIYDKMGLLGPKTILGHGIHLSEEEWKLLKKRKIHFAHCPTSNAPISQRGLGSGLFDFKKANRYGISWAFGSDVGAGPYLSLWDVMRSFVHQNKGKKLKEELLSEAFYRATLAGAKILGKAEDFGNLEVGKKASFVFVRRPRRKRSDTGLNILEGFLRQYQNQRQNYPLLHSGFVWNGSWLQVSDEVIL